MLNALSIDLEEWFCVSNFGEILQRSEWSRLESRVEASTARILTLLERHGVKATFFVLGWVAERHGDLIRKIASHGHEIASHGYDHRLVFDQSPEEFQADVARSLEILRRAAGTEPRGYRAPSFSVRRDMDWVWRTLAELGIRYDSSLFPVFHDRYGDPSAPRFPFVVRTGASEVLELPLSTISMFSKNVPVAGGGYFRLYPSLVTRWAIRRINREGFPAVVYLHPWEFDPEHPRPKAPRLTLLRHRLGIRSVPRKLGRLLEEFRFSTMESVAQTLADRNPPPSSLSL